MADEPEYSLGLTTTLRETSGRALEAGKPLPWRFAQLAEDFYRRHFHQANKRQRANRVKRGARLSRRARKKSPHGWVNWFSAPSKQSIALEEQAVGDLSA